MMQGHVDIVSRITSCFIRTYGGFILQIRVAYVNPNILIIVAPAVDQRFFP